jgi:GH24 family phage-related lysozyme (muramidase)
LLALTESNTDDNPNKHQSQGNSQPTHWVTLTVMMSIAFIVVMVLIETGVLFPEQGPPTSMTLHPVYVVYSEDFESAGSTWQQLYASANERCSVMPAVDDPSNNVVNCYNIENEYNSWKVPLEPHWEYELSYDLWFDDNWEFVQGGKLGGGFHGGDVQANGCVDQPPNAWSMRTGFSSTQYLNPYSYDQGRLTSGVGCGTSGKGWETIPFLEKEKWYRIEIHIWMNSAANVTDGGIILRVNGQYAWKDANMEWWRGLKENNETPLVDNMWFNMGHGGSGPDTYPSKAVNASFDNFVVRRWKQCSGEVAPIKCHENAECVMPWNRCSCKEGFRGDGVNLCTPVETCEVWGRGCGPGKFCVPHSPPSTTGEGYCISDCTDTSSKQTWMKCRVNHCKTQSWDPLSGDCKRLPDMDVRYSNDMSNLFYDAQTFNMDISKWNVESVTTFRLMFSGTDAFNADISSWDTRSLTGDGMVKMFLGAYPGFNGDLSRWDVSRITSLQDTFRSTAFNGNITTWNVSSLTTMREAFKWTSNFNQDLSRWDVSSVEDFFEAFRNTGMDQNLCSWVISPTADTTNVFQGAPQSTFCPT